MIDGLHTMIYSSDAERTRAFLKDVLGLSSVDAGQGWLIFALPPAEMGVHPAAGAAGGEHSLPAGTHELSLMCDDIVATVAELERKGAKMACGVSDQGWGLVAMIQVPGAGQLRVYQPRHPRAHGAEPVAKSGRH
ncbi:MAG TPA: VOC family protein [Phycisphaerales bacterium]|nr:VOC family protein [Phycisphaerales bacterium]